MQTDADIAQALSEMRHHFPNEWLAIADGEVIAHAETSEALSTKVQALGRDDLYFAAPDETSADHDLTDFGPPRVRNTWQLGSSPLGTGRLSAGSTNDKPADPVRWAPGIDDIPQGMEKEVTEQRLRDWQRQFPGLYLAVTKDQQQVVATGLTYEELALNLKQLGYITLSEIFLVEPAPFPLSPRRELSDARNQEELSQLLSDRLLENLPAKNLTKAFGADEEDDPDQDEMHLTEEDAEFDSDSDEEKANDERSYDRANETGSVPGVDGERPGIRNDRIRRNAIDSLNQVIDDLSLMEGDSIDARIGRDVVPGVLSICVGALDLNQASVDNLETMIEQLKLALGVLRPMEDFLSKDDSAQEFSKQKPDILLRISQASAAIVSLLTIWKVI